MKEKNKTSVQSSNDIKTDSGINLDAYYQNKVTGRAEEAQEKPGQYPYTRGIYAEMYRSRLWTMRQYSGFATAEETNRRYRHLIENGQTGLSVAFDLPTQMGYDSDHPLAEGEVGKAGVAIDSLLDMEHLFDGIKLDKISSSMTINATAAILLAMYIAVAKKQQADLKQLGGTIQNDILKEYIARSTYIYPPEPSMRLVTDIFDFCKRELPKWNTISISGYHIREAGANAVQELAFTLANAICYVEHAIKAGLDPNKFGERLSFFFACHNDFFEEIAKFRAARRLWARIMHDRFKVGNPKALLLRFHTQTAGSTLTAQQPDNNISRVTLQALAAVLGGTQSLHTNARDEALALPTESSARTALRTQQLIAFESGVTRCADPLGGSALVESLTDELEQRVGEYLEKVENMGGALIAIGNQYFQNEIALSAHEYQKAIESGERIIVGVNAFQEPEEPEIEILRVDPEIQRKQLAKLEELKQTRNNSNVTKTLAILKSTAESDGNLMPVIIDCVEHHVTLGEISDTLRSVFGVYKEN